MFWGDLFCYEAWHSERAELFEAVKLQTTRKLRQTSLKKVAAAVYWKASSQQNTVYPLRFSGAGVHSTDELSGTCS